MPDLLIIGDSHSIALKAGCDALGLKTELLSFSGNIWHAGHVVFTRRKGLWVYGKRSQTRIADLRARLGGAEVLSQDLPVLVSAGFHMGRIVPPFGMRRHFAEASQFEQDEDGLFASRALVEAYARHYRGAHVELLRQMARRAPVVAVAPPNIYPNSNYSAFHDVIAGMIRSAGVTFYDPREDFGGPGQALGEEYRAPDRGHGNAAYGAKLIGRMLEQGLIRRRGD